MGVNTERSEVCAHDRVHDSVIQTGSSVNKTLIIWQTKTIHL